jgi:hypothetical protein
MRGNGSALDVPPGTRRKALELALEHIAKDFGEGAIMRLGETFDGIKLHPLGSTKSGSGELPL